MSTNFTGRSVLGFAQIFLLWGLQNIRIRILQNDWIQIRFQRILWDPVLKNSEIRIQNITALGKPQKSYFFASLRVIINLINPQISYQI